MWAAVGAILGLLGVAAGAFGAHGLRGHLSPESLTIFEIAVRYQMYHALALLALGFYEQARPRPAPLLRAAGTLFLVGTLIFSGSLYALAITQIRWLGAITPLGGVSFLVAWFLVLVAVWPRRANSSAATSDRSARPAAS